MARPGEERRPCTRRSPPYPPTRRPCRADLLEATVGAVVGDVEMAPPPGSLQLVGVATWLWIDAGACRTLTASAAAGPVTATATATPSKVVWGMGDGDTVTRDGPATDSLGAAGVLGRSFGNDLLSGVVHARGLPDSEPGWHGAQQDVPRPGEAAGL